MECEQRDFGQSAEQIFNFFKLDYHLAYSSSCLNFNLVPLTP